MHVVWGQTEGIVYDIDYVYERLLILQYLPKERLVTQIVVNDFIVIYSYWSERF